MAHPKLTVGMYAVAKPPLALFEQTVSAAEELGMDSVFVWDHIVDFFP